MLATRFGRELSSNFDENLPKEGIQDSLTICVQLADQRFKRQATLNATTSTQLLLHAPNLCVFA
jgi:hypothetical protein